MIGVLVLMLITLCGCQTAKQPHDPKDLQSVLKEVKQSFNMQDARAKYCPVCGKHYSGHLEKCPVDGAKLILIE